MKISNIKGVKMKVLLSVLALSFSANMMAANTQGPTQLDDLIRGEMAAVKAYDSILTKVKDEKELKSLKTIREDHVAAVGKLKTFASSDVKEDTKTAGPWGTFAEAWTGGAKLMGNETALKAVIQGEEHGITEYKEALEDDTIKSELKQAIRTQFLPKQQEHIKTIKSMM